MSQVSEEKSNLEPSDEEVERRFNRDMELFKKKVDQYVAENKP